MNYRSSVNDVIDRENKRRARSIFFLCCISLCFYNSAYIYIYGYLFLSCVLSFFFFPIVLHFRCFNLLLCTVFILVLRERVLSCFLALSSQFFFSLQALIQISLSLSLSLTISPSISHHLNIYA